MVGSQIWKAVRKTKTNIQNKALYKYVHASFLPPTFVLFLFAISCFNNYILVRFSIMRTLLAVETRLSLEETKS